jgi:hypothetical protein
VLIYLQMSVTAPLAATSPEPGEVLAGETDVERTERQLRTLRRIADRGADLADTMAMRAQAASDIDEAREASLIYDRASRSVRRTLAMEMRLVETHRAQKAKARREAAEAKAADTRRRVAERKRHVLETIADAVETAEDEGELGEAFSGDIIQDLYESLERIDEADETFADRPIDEVIARLCKDVGLTPDGRATLLTKEAAQYDRLVSAARTGGPEALAALRSFTFTPAGAPASGQTGPP